jgi:hypothetical protein
MVCVVLVARCVAGKGVDEGRKLGVGGGGLLRLGGENWKARNGDDGCTHDFICKGKRWVRSASRICSAAEGPTVQSLTGKRR